MYLFQCETCYISWIGNLYCIRIRLMSVLLSNLEITCICFRKAIVTFVFILLKNVWKHTYSRFDAQLTAYCIFNVSDISKHLCKYAHSVYFDQFMVSSHICQINKLVIVDKLWSWFKWHWLQAYLIHCPKTCCNYLLKNSPLSTHTWWLITVPWQHSTSFDINVRGNFSYCKIRCSP